MDEYQSSYFWRLPNEILCMIFKNLPREDKIALQFAYPFFSAITGKSFVRTYLTITW